MIKLTAALIVIGFWGVAISLFMKANELSISDLGYNGNGGAVLFGLIILVPFICVALSFIDNLFDKKN